MKVEQNWRLDTLLSHLSLELLVITVSSNEGGLGSDVVASIGKLLLSSNCPKHVEITDNRSSITAEVAASQEVYEKCFDNRTSSVKKKKNFKYIQCRLDWYSVGYIIAHSNFQWMLTVEEGRLGEKVIGEEEVRMLVAGANTRQNTSARVVGLRGYHMKSGDYCPLSISAEALNVLFVGLKNVLHLQELHLTLPAECSSISWPSLSGIRVLHLEMKDGRNWRLDTLLPHLSLELLVIKVSSDEGGLGLDNAACIGELLLSSNCPKCVDITDNTDKGFSITAEVAAGQHVHEKQFYNRNTLVKKKKTVEHVRCCLDCYSMGYVLAHNNFRWTVEQNRWGKEVIVEEVKKLVDGFNTRKDTSAKVIGLRGGTQALLFRSGDHCPLTITAEALNVFFVDLKNVLHLQELHLKLPAECSNIQWPNLSELRVLTVRISGKRNYRLDGLLPDLSLESLTISSDGTVALEDCVAIGMFLSSSDCLTYLYLTIFMLLVWDFYINAGGMEPITKALSENKSLPLRYLGVELRCTFSDTAAHHLALFITNSATLHHLTLWGCTLSAHGLLELAQAILHSSSLQERKLENLTCTVDGDDEAAQLSVDYPQMMGCLSELTASHITDRGAQAIATALSHNSTLWRLSLSKNSIGDAGSAALAQALHHNSTLKWLDLSDNNIGDAGLAALAKALHHNSTLEKLDLSDNNIGDAGSAALAEALHHNSTLEELDLSGNDAIGEESTHQLFQALTVNTSITTSSWRCGLVLPWMCMVYVTQCPQYSEVEHRIMFD